MLASSWRAFWRFSTSPISFLIVPWPAAEGLFGDLSFRRPPSPGLRCWEVPPALNPGRGMALREQILLRRSLPPRSIKTFFFFFAGRKPEDPVLSVALGFREQKTSLVCSES